MVLNLDLAPTFLTYGNAKIPEQMQGISFRNLFTKDNLRWRDAVYYHYYDYPGPQMVKRHFGVRTHRYKLIHFYYDIDEWELYDLQNDPDEMNSVYNHPEYKEIQRDLHMKLNELRKIYGDSKELAIKQLPNE